VSVATLVTLSVLYVTVAVFFGWLLRWIDQTPCDCGEPAPNRGWWSVLLVATLWPAAIVEFLINGRRGH
jgi:hypothetical protein